MRLKARPQRASLRVGEETPDPLSAGVAYVVLFLLFVKAPGLTLIPAMAMPAFGLLVVGFFWPTVRAAKGTGGLLCGTVIAIVVGLVLRLQAYDVPLVTNTPTQLSMILLWVVAFPALVLAGYWALERVDLFRGTAVALAGAVASSLFSGVEIGWKGDLGIFVTMFLLALTARKMQLTRLVLGGAAVANVLSDSRAMAFVAVAALICTCLTRQNLRWVRQHPGKSLSLIIAGFLLTSFAMVQAMLLGWLGQEIQRRTSQQLGGGRDLISAGRTEWAATLELFRQSPWGFGAGVTPNGAMQRDAIGATQNAGGDYTNTVYWTDSVFGDRTDLHSALADLWAHFGIGGVILAAAIATIFAAAVPRAVGLIRELGAVPLFAILTGAWDLLFSPMGNSDRIIMGLLAAVVLGQLARNPGSVPIAGPAHAPGVPPRQKRVLGTVSPLRHGR